MPACLPACITPPPAPCTPLATVRGRESAQTVCCVPLLPPTMHHQASFLGVVAPWLVTMFCYQGSLLVSFCNWSALLTIGTVNLVVPLAVYREALRRYPLITGETNGTALLQEVTDRALCTTAPRHQPRACVIHDDMGCPVALSFTLCCRGSRSRR
jgi:hypothetical protein